jgi:hypothetical protein
MKEVPIGLMSVGLESRRLRLLILLGKFVTLETARAFHNIQRSVRLQVALLVPPRSSIELVVSGQECGIFSSICLLEERVTQNDIVHTCQTDIVNDISVDEEEHWKVDGFSCPDLLLLETEAFHFGEIRCHLMGAEERKTTIYIEKRQSTDVPVMALCYR